MASPDGAEVASPAGLPATEPYAAVRETHTGVVVLVGDRAFKSKKPVLTDFVDFRTPQQRERACSREVTLNRRLAPQSYLGLATFSDPAGGPAEPVVVMRRYHDTDRLASMVTRGDSAASIRTVLDNVASVLGHFHEHAQRSPVISAQGTMAAIERRWRANLSELDRYAQLNIAELPVASISRIQRLAAEFLAGRGPLFTRRIADGCIVDGHGDLLADDIFWVHSEPILLDCLEFDDELRYLDRIDDAAFLAMDLEFLGHKDFGSYFLDRYCAMCTDTAPQSLRDFYLAYRAVVRAKVDCVRLLQGQAPAAADAAAHLGIAERHLRSGAVRLALIGGSPGSGKSTLAHILAKKVGAQLISTDDVRQQLRESGIIAGEPGLVDAGLYSPDHVSAVYREVLRRARLALSDGQSAVLDGTWRNPKLRAQAYWLAAQTHSTMIELCCAATPDVAAERIRTRRPGRSEVTPQIAAALAAQDSGWDNAHRVDTSGPLGASVRAAHSIWCQAI